MRLFLIVIALIFALLPTSLAAHHGGISYEAGTTLTIEGPLTSLLWIIPHGAATIRYQGRNWDVVLAPVSRMETRGLSEAMLKPGRKVTLIGYPRSDGAAEMRIERVIVAGKTYELR